MMQSSTLPIKSLNKSILQYCNRRMLVILLLGFASGLPFALVNSALQAWFKQSGLDIQVIGCLSLVGMPYSYKFLWAPLMDRFCLPFLGRRRGWIVCTQLCVILITTLIAGQNPANHPLILSILAAVLAFCAASHDVVIDALRTDILPSDERGLGAAMASEGYRIGMLVASGGAMILADHIGWHLTYIIMASLVSVGTIAVFMIQEPEMPHNIPTNFKALVAESFQDFLKRPFAKTLLALIIVYKLGDAFSTSLSTTFLLDIGFSLTAVGTINKVVGASATLFGIFVGGVIITRAGLFKSLLVFGVLQAVGVLAYMVLALVGKNYAVATFAFAIECLCGGMGSAALGAFLMSLCNPKFSATQFALFSSLTAIGRTLAGPISGFMVKQVGWAAFYFSTAFLAIPGIVLILHLRKTIIALSYPQRSNC